MSLSLKDVMDELKKNGTAQNVKIYRRRGATGELFGVSFAHLKDLTKRIGIDHDLAEQLWATGNIDARTLATMIADPGKMTSEEADRWAKEIDYYVVADYLGSLIARGSLAHDKIELWTQSKDEFVRQAGYSALASSLKQDSALSDDDCRGMLKRIEEEIHNSPNRARQAMNNALIAIGVFRPHLTDEAVGSATRIGKVEVDHGDTSCKTPDAISYIYHALKSR